MKKLNELQSYLTRLRGLMLTLIILCSIGSGNVWGALPANPTWTATALGSIPDGSTVIIMSSSSHALPSTTTGSNPAKISCTVTTSAGVSTISPASGTLQALAWTLTKVNSNYKFYQEGSNAIRLFLNSTTSNTALRVGNGQSSNDQFVMGSGGKLLKVTTATRYVGPYSSGSDWRTYNSETHTNYGSASLTFYVLNTGGGSTPTITTSSSMTTLTYSNGSPVAQSFTVGGTNLTADVRVTAPTDYEVSTNNSTFSDYVDLSYGSGTLSNTTVYIRLKSGLSGGNIASRNISLTSTGATTQTIAVTGSVPYTITWMANGNLHATTYVAVGSTLALPATNPVPNSCGCTGKAFFGWYGLGTSYKHASNAPSIAAAGDAVSADKTYYAVFADAEEGDPVYTKVTSITAGTYVMVSEKTASTYRYMPNTTSSSTNPTLGSGITMSTTAGVTTLTNAITDAMLWDISTGETSGYFYVRPHGSATIGLGTTNSTGGNIRISTTYVNTEWRFTTSASYGWEIYNGNMYLAVYADNAWRNYSNNSTNQNGTFYMFKQSGGTTYSNYDTSCCTPLGTINGSVSSSTPTSVTLQWDKLSNVDGTTPYAVSVSPSAGTSVGGIDLSGAKATCSVTGLTPCTAYTFTINAYGDATHCDKSQDVAHTTAGYTLTVTKNGVTLSSGSEPSNICANVSATYAASTGYSLPSTITVTNAGAQNTSWTWNSGTGVLTINKANVTGNVTVTISGTCVEPAISAGPADADYYQGDSPDALEVTATLASGTLTYLWKVSTNGGSTWNDAEGTNNLATYNGASLSTASAGTIKFKCIVGNSQGGCTVESGIATITVATPSSWKLKGSWDDWTEYTMVEDAGVASYSINLAADSRFEFGFDGGSFYKNNGTIITTTSGWVFNTSDNNCHIHTGPAGTYTFAINTSTKAVTVTYPTVSHPNEHYVYFKNTNVWGTVYGYLANSGNDNKAAAWPGSVMQPTTTICGETYHYAALNAMSGTYNTIIFNNGNTGYGNQTSDLSTTGSLGKYNANQDANWHQFKYAISFAGNGNTDGSMSSITDLCPGSNQALTTNAFTKDHYTFAGWHADVDVKVGESTIEAGDMISDGATIKDIQSDIALTAQWSPVSYTITKTFSNVANAGLPASFTYTGAATTALNSTFTVDATNFFLPSSIAVTMGGTPLTAGTDYTYDNSNGAFTFSAVITGDIVITASATAKLKSIAITTQPTTLAYLEGESFSSTGAVVRATMGDATTKDVTASVTWTPAGALSAGTSQTVTATYTEAGIEKTATTTIDVYSVTVNKVNMSGTAIADAGVTASCSGRTLSQSVSTTNYKFNSWVVTAGGVSVSTNTITGTPTGNVTINAKFHDPITVTWLVGSGAASGSPTTEVKYNTAITALPSTPADNALASCGTNKFMGWSKSELKGTGHDAPADLFTTVGGATALTENTTYRAVFANQAGGGATVNTVMYSETFEGYSASDVPSGSVSTSSTNRVVYNSGSVTYTCVNGSSNTKIYTDNLAEGDGVTELLVGKSGGSFTVAGIPSGGAATLTVTYKTNAKSMTVSTTGTGYSGSCTASTKEEHSFDVTVGSESTFTLIFTPGSDNVRLDDIKVKVKTAGTTTSDYQTGCCEAPGTALSITSANSVATGGTVSLTSTGGNGGTVTWSVVNGTGSATVVGTTLTAGSIGTVTVKAHQDANTVLGTEYCAQDAEQAFTVVSSTVNVTSVSVDPTSKAILVGETFTITPTVLPANATDKSVSWTSGTPAKATVNSSGVVTGVAAGTSTITCETTDGGLTATCVTTVYSASVTSIVDEDGTDISASGVSAEVSGRTLTASEGSTNYKFKTWKYGTASGTSISSATSLSTSLTGTPNGNVTLIAEFYKPVEVAWTKGGTTYSTGGPTTSVKRGTQWKDLTIPTAPGDATLGACANKFKGWSNCSDLIGTGHSAPGVLFTSVSGITTEITEDIEFKAVFATDNKGTWTLDYSEEEDLRTSSSWGSYGTAYNYTASDGGTWTVKANKSSGMQINAGKNSSIKIPDCSGDITSIVVTGGNKTVRFSQSDYDGSSFGVIEVTGSDAYTQTLDFAGKSLTAGYIVPHTNANQITKIVVNYGSTSDYVTQCDPNQVRVTYDANGGSTTCAGGSHDKRNDYTVCSSAPTKDYYSFDGWLCSADDEVYAASATIDDAVIDADFSLTAQWTPVTYNITYNLHGGTTAGGNPTTYDVETATIDLADGTYGHNRFEGWYSTYNDGTGAYSDQVTSIPLGSHGDITLHAKWTTRHEIIFDADGTLTTIYRADDEAMDASVAGQGSVPSDPSAPSTCSTKVFVGWSESEIDDETNTRPSDLMKPAEGKVDEDKHYYAVWALRAGSPAPATYAGTGTFVKITSMSEVETETYYVLRGIKDASTIKVLKNTISSGKMGTADDPVSENVITNPGVAIVWKLGGTKDAYTLYNQSASKYVEITANSTGGYALNSSATTSYTLTIEEGHGFFFKSNHASANSRGISIYDASEFRSYGLANAKTLELYKLPAYTYSAYSTSCCETKVNLTHNSPEHGTVEFNKSRIGTCNSDKNVALIITPDAGYKLTGWTVNTASGYADAKTTNPAVVTTNNNSAAQNITLTFAQDANKNYDVTATFGLMTVESWTWTHNSAAISDPFNLYVGQTARFDVVYTPAGVDNSKKTYTRTKEDAYINWSGAQQATYSTISGKASTGENTTPVTFTHADGPTTTVNVKVLPLPAVHFGDIVHNVSFDDVVATLSDNTLSPTKTTPTHADFTGSTANTCEEQHLHLVGWIREDWPDLVTYLNGGAQPGTDDITGAGNDASGNAYFFAPDASINTLTFNGVTFYAVWAKVE